MRLYLDILERCDCDGGLLKQGSRKRAWKILFDTDHVRCLDAELM